MLLPGISTHEQPAGAVDASLDPADGRRQLADLALDPADALLAPYQRPMR